MRTIDQSLISTELAVSSLSKKTVGLTDLLLSVTGLH